MAVAAPERLYFTNSDEANELLASDPLALLIGFALDQQVPVQTAFAGPLKIKERLGTLEIAHLDPMQVEAAFREKPAVHRFPGSMATRVQDLAALVEEEYGGDASRLWREASDADDLKKRISGAPRIRRHEDQGALGGALEAVRGSGGRGADAGPSDARRRGLPREARLVPGEEARAQGQDARAGELRPRPPVTAYVTREHPETGADELLVFDVPGMPEYTSVVTGGGIEQGETIAETAVREVKEEAGIDVVFVRELGVAESPTGHYVQVTSTEQLPETWEHDGRAFRWLPVSADLELWGQRGDFVSALVRKRVVGYVTRGRELLVFDHKGRPEVPTQVPAGRVDAHEGLEEGLRREVEEETGLTEIEIVGILADGNEFEELFGPGAHESHAFHAVAAPGGPDSWEHAVSGTGMDSGLVYVCRWVPLDECPPLWGDADPLAERLRVSITEP